MQKIFIITLFVLTFSSCYSVQDDVYFDSDMDRKLREIVEYLNKEHFEGTFNLNNSELKYKYSNSQPKIEKHHIETLTALQIQGVTRTNEFVFFVTKGWKGNNFGFLFTKEDIKNINGVDEYKELLKGSGKRINGIL